MKATRFDVDEPEVPLSAVIAVGFVVVLILAVLMGVVYLMAN